MLCRGRGCTSEYCPEQYSTQHHESGGCPSKHGPDKDIAQPEASRGHPSIFSYHKLSCQYDQLGCLPSKIELDFAQLDKYGGHLLISGSGTFGHSTIEFVGHPKHDPKKSFAEPLDSGGHPSKPDPDKDSAKPDESERLTLKDKYFDCGRHPSKRDPGEDFAQNDESRGHPRTCGLDKELDQPGGHPSDCGPDKIFAPPDEPEGHASKHGSDKNCAQYDESGGHLSRHGPDRVSGHNNKSRGNPSKHGEHPNDFGGHPLICDENKHLAQPLHSECDLDADFPQRDELGGHPSNCGLVKDFTRMNETGKQPSKHCPGGRLTQPDKSEGQPSKRGPDKTFTRNDEYGGRLLHRDIDKEFTQHYDGEYGTECGRETNHESDGSSRSNFDHSTIPDSFQSDNFNIHHAKLKGSVSPVGFGRRPEQNSDHAQVALSIQTEFCRKRHPKRNSEYNKLKKYSLTEGRSENGFKCVKCIETSQPDMFGDYFRKHLECDKMSSSAYLDKCRGCPSKCFKNEIKVMRSLWRSLSMIVMILLLQMMIIPKTKCTLARGVVLFLSASAIASPTYAVNTFSIIPSSQLVSVGEEAVFNCRYPTADLIDWFVNGSLVGANPPPDVFPSTFQTDNGTIVYTLTIVGRPEYNGTVVVCEAFFRDGRRSEHSPEALLQVLLEIYTTTPLTTPPPTTPAPTTPPPTTPAPTTPPPTTPPPTTPPPTTPSPPTPPLTVSSSTTSPAGEFVLLPIDQVVAQGQQAVFNCEHSGAHAIGWRLNGIPLLDTSLVGVEARSTSLPGGVLNTLTIEARPEYNMTRIECVAFFGDSSPKITEAVSLIIQGPLEAVTNLASTRAPFHITWEPPFSLNLTGVEPDIIYCIEIVAIESDCESTEGLLVPRDCNVTTNYYDGANLNPGYTYNITVTPRSNVDDALLGHTSVLEEEFASLLDPSISVSTITSDNQNFSIILHFEMMGNIEPATYTLSLDAVDGEPDPESFSSLPVTNINYEDSIALQTALPRHRLWLCTAFPNNCTGSDGAISDTEELSTHDVQNVSVTVASHQGSGEVQVFGDFVPGTSATGALMIIYSNELTRYHLAQREGNRKLDTTVPNLPGGTYKVSVFTIEENGVPFGRVVKKPMSIDVTHEDNSETQLNAPHVIEYDLTSDPNLNEVNLTCFFLEESTTDCVVIVHNANTALSLCGIMNISSHVFTRSEGGNSASGYIKGVNLQEYQFGVIGGELRENDVHTNVARNDVSVYIVIGTTVTATLVLLSLLALIAAIFVLKVKRRQQIRYFEQSMENVENKENIYIQVALKNTRQTSQNSGAYQPSTDEERVYDELSSVIVQESALDESVPHEKSQDIKYASVACATAGYKLDTYRADKATIQDKTKVIYSDIRPDEKNEHCHVEPAQVSSQDKDCSKKPVPVQMPLTVDTLFDQLWPLHDKWQKLGDVMSLSEHLLDEIFTNNEDDESCLRDLLEFYMKAGERQHTWEEIHSFVKVVGDEDLADKIYTIHIQPYTQGPLKLQDDSETWSTSAVEQGVCQPKSDVQPQPPSCSAEVKVCSQTTHVTSIVTDHVMLRGKKDRPVGFQTSCTPFRYLSWPASVANSPYHHSVARVSSPGIPREDTYSEGVNSGRHHGHLLHNTNVNDMSQSRASAPFILSRGSLQSPKKVEQPLTQSHECITEEGYNRNNVNDVGRAVSCSAMQTLGFDDSKGADEPKVDLCSESEPNDDRSQLSLNNCENF